MRNNRLFLPLFLTFAVAACGKPEAPQPKPAAPAPQAAAPAAAPPPAAPAADPALAKGEEVYKKICVLCHKTGEAGAPKIGVKEDWTERIAQPKDTLYEHAIKGYQGKKGMMPAKGGNPALSDDEVKAAVDYLLAQAK